MLELVDVGPRSLSAYRGVAPDAVLDGLVRHAEDLRGARVLHVNATPYGGGVSELLRSGVPILNDLGLIAHWKIIRGDGRFFQVTKKTDGAGGALVHTVEECAKAVVALLRDPEHARDLARKGRERVREHFLLPRLLLNELELMQELAAGRPIVPVEHRDPVCGMSVSVDGAAPEARFAEATYRFCSDACREQFLRDPAHYVVRTHTV